ncbi:MAG: hypothetical protein KJO01_09000 [Gammaproteobacteria bacterium]|nr:hypothetical protein [Gammaproteobacteria bacterium]MBT8112022.1 hypothetical protein [Gammaproteobacteria bacterium]NND48115.1 hypothetical protein [Woeseiaceae bacterium]NNL46723.1 hypothetical protein [Woeseiaceae bacterium]
MTTRIKTTVSTVLATVLLCSINFYAVAQETACDRDPETFKLKIKVKNDTPTKVVKGFFGSNADTLNVCRGDTIEWKFNKKKFFIEFPGKTPFDEKKKSSKNGKVTTTVRSDAERGVSYKYDIGIDGGGVLDPRIIVDE